MRHFLACLFAGGTVAAFAQSPEYRPHMDEAPETFWDARLGLALPAETNVKDWDDLWVWDFHGRGEFFFYEHPQGGDFEFGGRWDAWVLNGFDGLGSGYPLVAARLTGRYSQRYQEGFGLNFLVEPGLYTTFDQLGGKDLAFPFGIIGEKAFNDRASIQVGGMIYPGFDQTIDPRFSLRLTNVNGLAPGRMAVTADIGYPETQLRVKPDPDFTVRLGAAMLTWAEFQMDENDPRDRIQYDETRVYGGVAYDISDTLNFTLELGYLLGRELDFEKASPKVDIDDAPYFRVGIQGRL
jgi:hypothetical protein